MKKRFPHYDHLVEAGILEKGEKKVQINIYTWTQNESDLTQNCLRYDKDDLYFASSNIHR